MFEEKNYRVLVGMIVLATPSLLFAQGDVSAGLEHCSTIDDATARLACYDELSGRQMPPDVAPAVVPAPPPESPPEAPAQASTGSSIDELGSESLSGAPEKEELAVRATVTKCQKDSRKRYFFFFENGQVWKQASDKRLYFRDCNFEVTITKDYFGYKMQRDGEKGRTRISRVK